MIKPMKTSAEMMDQYRMINLERLRISVSILKDCKLDENQSAQVYAFVYDMLTNITDPERHIEA